MPENTPTRERSDSFKIFTSFHNYYELLDTIASGSFATVKLGRYSITGEHVAVKIVNKIKLDKIAINHLASETSCLRLIQHPNVVKLYDLYESPSKLYFVMELGDGDLYQHILSHYKDLGMPEDSVRYFFRQIVSAIDYCHKIQIVHRDLKPQNIIIFKATNVVKLADFGFSRACAPEHYLNTTCGSLPYTAPEVFLDESYDPRKSDIWSVAVVLCTMLTGQIPFDHVNQSEMLTMVLDCNYNLPSFVSEEAKELVSKLLRRYPDERLLLPAIFNTSFYKDNLEEMEDLQGKTLAISKVLHRYVISEIIQNKISTHIDVLKSLINQKCDFISAAYHLIANDAFKKANSQDTINYVLVVDDVVIQEDYQLLCSQQTKSNIEINLIPVEQTGLNEDIFHEISLSMEDVSLNCHSLHKSHSLRQPRKKKKPITSMHQNGNSTINLEPVRDGFKLGGVRSVKSIKFKSDPSKTMFGGRSRRTHSPGLHSLSEMSQSENSTEQSSKNKLFNMKATSITCLVKPNKFGSPLATSSENTSSNVSKTRAGIPKIVNRTPSSSIDGNNRSTRSESGDSIDANMSLLMAESVVCRSKSLNTKSKKRFIEIFGIKK